MRVWLFVKLLFIAWVVASGLRILVVFCEGCGDFDCLHSWIACFDISLGLVFSVAVDLDGLVPWVLGFTLVGF